MNLEVETPVEKKRFLPAFGKTAILLAIFGIIFSALSSAVIGALHNFTSAEQVGQEPSLLVIATQLLFVVIIFCAMAGAFIFGLLSLFGYGKVDGSSRPLYGSVGLLLSLIGVTIMGDTSDAPAPEAPTEDVQVEQVPTQQIQTRIESRTGSR
ncbi:hypothetical protein Pla110_18650 [Polystyrenella longa]|uniref:Uncharacterized protein n=1 Tax=Polystyrenella longa TaxID=2528007 RepID=A0A518CLP6_9PLAN|nr:hypothetical protein [Polystyrenella longa]QDU80142.1 hypothetical protein Pla110_18650 [Polystyrenella longa]